MKCTFQFQNDKSKVAAEKPFKAAEKPSKKDATSVAITERPVSRKPAEQKVDSRRAARGRSRFRSANIETTEQPDKKESEAKAKLEQKEEPKSTKRDKIKPETAEVKEKKNDAKKVEKVDKQKEQKESEDEKKIKEEEAAAEEEEKNLKPWKTSSVKNLQQKVAAARNDAEKWKHDKFESKRKNSSQPDNKDSNKSEPKESDEEEEEEEKEKHAEPKKSRIASPSAEERRNGRRYHDIQIVQLESEIEEDGKYRYKQVSLIIL